MFLQSLRSKNPAFVESAVALHQAGAIPANSYAVDLDAVSANTAHLVGEAKALGLTVYAMTKQLGRAPSALNAITGAGVDGYVAVDMACARPITANGHNLGHIGHLVQVAAAETGEAIAMEPDYWTVFSPNKAAEASAAAARLGRVQKLLVRVFADGDEFYTGHEGGVPIEELSAMIDHIGGLPGVRFAGLTTFPALLFDPHTGGARVTPNMATLARAAESARQHLGGEDQDMLQINAPGTTSTAVLSKLAEAGATQVEPGHGLTGTTPLHAVGDLPEQPAVCYVSEIAHIHQGIPFCFGGGLYIDPVFGDYQTTAVVAHDPSEAVTEPVPVDMPEPAAIDYYAKLRLEPGRTVSEGDTVVFGFRIQAFVTRAFVVGVAGVRSDNPSVAGVWDVLGNPVAWKGSR
ncbi:MAG: YhfX family PLP-dependent enzyme [Acidimicrobiia bacterium]|nr:YhfX family PLP-dependent enzyme [Acidimicrobiia bacterium]MYG71123.1 YhfX family PLP-dependent enzyme [Acidimicrobiia bacterium]